MNKQSITTFAEECTYAYGSFTIENRALPDFRDGQKPSHRRILWAMYKSGFGSNTNFRKSARTIGECFPPGTLVSTPTGKIPIEDLQVGDLVLTSTSRPKEVVETYHWPKETLIEVTTDLNSVRATVKQEFKVKIGDEFFWKTADELEPGDAIVIETEV